MSSTYQQILDNQVYSALQIACIPPHEADRMVALRSLELLDSPPTESFARVTRLAAAALDFPMAFVALADETRQWFKSRFGTDGMSTSREMSFCSHTLDFHEALIVPDASRDPRFANHPFVKGAPFIRACVGIPLLTRDGQTIGTLCALDTRPRDLDEVDVDTLRDYAKIIEASIHAQELAAQADSLLHVAVQREALFRDTFEQAAVGIVHADVTGRVQRANQRACVMLGYAPEELADLSLIDITHPDDIAEHAKFLEQMAADRCDSFRLEKRFLRKDGDYLWSAFSAALKRSPSGEPAYILVVLEDVSARKHAEAELLRARDVLEAEVEQKTLRLRMSNDALKVQIKKVLDSERSVREVERRLRTIANNVPVLIGYWNRDLVCEFANQRYHDFFEMKPNRIIGMTLEKLVGEIEFARMQPQLRMVFDGHTQRFERTHTRSDGEELRIEIQFIPDTVREAEIRGFSVLAVDVTAARASQQALEAVNNKLVNDSTTDYLTGLANRRVFSECSEAAWKRFKKSGEVCALILLDLDDFKRVNDEHGHSVGDDVLRAVGRLLKAQLRGQRDIAARLGGEEFAILCFGEMDEELASQIAERLRARICRESVDTGKGFLEFTASFGLALSHGADFGWKDIYARADAALYQAKAAGKNQVRFGAAAQPVCKALST